MSPIREQRPDGPSAFPIDWGQLVPLRLRALAIAEGYYAGLHRSTRKGAGVEFAGQRPYVPGDDLRFFDRRALLRHDRLMVREFEMETDRAVWLCIDATASMSYRGTGPASKLAFAAMLAAALGRIALASGDPVGLAWIGGNGVRALPARGGRDSFERLLGALESCESAGDLVREPTAIDLAVGAITRRAARGAIVVILSDLIDLPERALSSFATISTRRRKVVVVQTLDPREAKLDFEGTVRLRALEGGAVVETDPNVTRRAYLERLAAIQQLWAREMQSRGGDLIVSQTTDEPVSLVRRIVMAAAGTPMAADIGDRR